MAEKKLVFVLSKGLNYPDIARTTLMLAALSANLGIKTTVFCFQDGVEIMVKGALDKEEVKPGVPTIRQRLNEAIEAGVKIYVCSQTLVVRKIKEEDIIDEAEVAGAATFIYLALEADKVICVG
ncbi:DsrE family protein [Ferroglobus placidus]|uniref:DsrE family protein n=1 Tax=Ferroglobus placidus TaxID=54261 RepID=UPI0001B74E13|nr:DsrE family protein [Ferroglobus placidus]